MQKMKRLFAAALSTILLVSLLASCGGNNGSGTASGSASSAGVSQNTSNESTGANGTADVQELNLRAKAFGNNFDVQEMGWRWMMAACYEGLYRNLGDENGDRFELAGAEDMGVSEDGLVYTFKLRKDAKWSDGVAVTAKDYEYGWKRLIDPALAYEYSAFLFGVTGAEAYYQGKGSIDDVGIRAVDDYTFEVTLKEADPAFQYKLVATPLYPIREDLATAAGDNWGKDWTLNVYNGPFAVTELVEDNKMVWSKNEDYWNAANVQLTTVNWFCVAEDATASTMFENGQLDVFEAAGDYITKLSQQAQAGKYQSMSTQYPGTGLLSFEFKNGGLSGLMNNVKVRKAIAYAINKQEMIEAVYGRYTAAYGLVSPAITVEGKSYRAQAEEPLTAEYEEYMGNTEKLVALFEEGMKEAGVSGSAGDVTLTLLTYGSSTEQQTEREYIQQSLQQNLGVKVELNTVGDYAMFKASYQDLNFDLMVRAWYSDYNDPLDFLHIFQTGIYDSYGLYSNPDFDALMKTLAGENDIAKRMEIYKEAEKLLLVEEAACVPLYYADKHYFIQNWVKNFNTSSFGASQEPIETSISGKTA